MKRAFRSSCVFLSLFASLCSLTARASKEVQLATQDEVAQCKKLGVYRGKADQPLFRALSLEQLESEAMNGLMDESEAAKATHVVKGFTYRVGGSRSSAIEMVFQFGTAYECP